MSIEPEALILRKYGDRIVGLIKYGSMVYGQPRTGSIHDFWVIVDDLRAFHMQNAEFYRTQLKVPSTPEEQIRLNLIGPNFYSFVEEGVAMKLAVISERTFVRECHGRWMIVKGRMQKPLRVIRSTPRIEEAIAHARREGMLHAINLLPRNFTLDEFLVALVSLSYRAEIRPERKMAKVRSIVEAGHAELEKIYRPLLSECPFLERRGDLYVDTRDRMARDLAYRRTRAYLRKCKWSLHQLRYIYKNYRSYRTPISYILDKIKGEIEKWRKARKERASRRRRCSDKSDENAEA